VKLFMFIKWDNVQSGQKSPKKAMPLLNRPRRNTAFARKNAMAFAALFTVMLFGMSLPSKASGNDFQTRCSNPNVTKCVGFDSPSDISGSWGDISGILSGATTPTLDSTVKASGTSALKFTIPSNSGSDTSGSYFTNFSDDLLTQFGEGGEFYVQWRQRFSPEFLATKYSGGTGWKQSIIGEGDRAGVCDPNFPTSATCPTSCSQLEIVTQNTYQRAFPQMYHSCGGKDGSYEPLEVGDPSNQSIIYLQNAVQCEYNSGNNYQFPPCVGYQSNQWMTFQVHVKIGTWYKNNGSYKKDSTIQMWVAEEGKPSQLVMDFSPASGTGYDIANDWDPGAKYGKVWLLPYHSNKDSSQSHPTAYTWYDELIISKTKIPDPNSSGDLIAPAVPKNLRVN